MHKMSFCCCVRYFTVIFSCLYWISGLSIVVGSIWILNDPVFSLVFTQYGVFSYIVIYLVLFAGCFVLLSAWFACYGILKRSTPILGAFVFTLLIIVGSKIAAGTWILKNKDRISDIIRASTKYSIQEEYGLISTTTVTFDVIQKHLKCCGSDGPGDWIASRYNNVGREDIINIAFSSLNVFFNIPESCCNEEMSEIACELARKHKLDAVFPTGIYEKGCVSKLAQIASNNSKILLGVLISAITLEIVALVSSLFICCAMVKKSNKNTKFVSS